MATISDLTNAYLKRKGLFFIKGEENDIAPLVPLLMMNSAFLVYDGNIRKVDCRQELKKSKNDWRRAFNAFSHEYAFAWNTEQSIYADELLEKYNEYIEHDTLVAFAQLTNIFKAESFERQKVLAAAILINIFTQLAEIAYEKMYELALMKKDKNLLQCRRSMAKFAAIYYGNDRPDVNPNSDKSVRDAVDILCKKQLRYLKQAKENEKTNGRS